MAARVRTWVAVSGPPVPAEFRSVEGRAPIAAIVTVGHPDLAFHRSLSTDGEGYVVEEVLVFEREPSSSANLTRFGSQSRDAALSHTDFVDHWREIHGPLVRDHQPGIIRYVQHVVEEQLYGASLGVDGFHESAFRDENAYRDQLFDGAIGRTRLGQDSALLLADPQAEERVFVAREHGSPW